MREIVVTMCEQYPITVFTKELLKSHPTREQIDMHYFRKFIENWEFINLKESLQRHKRELNGIVLRYLPFREAE